MQEFNETYSTRRSKYITPLFDDDTLNYFTGALIWQTLLQLLSTSGNLNNYSVLKRVELESREFLLVPTPVIWELGLYTLILTLKFARFVNVTLLTVGQTCINWHTVLVLKIKQVWSIFEHFDKKIKAGFL